MKVKVLVVDDDVRLRKLCAGFLQRSGHITVAVEGGEQALKEAGNQRFDLVLTDIKMPGMSGDELIGHLLEMQPEIMPVIMTAHPSMDLAIDAVRKGVYEFITKPFRLDDFQRAINNVLQRRMEEIQRVQRDFVKTLLEIEEQLGDEFDLPKTIESLAVTGGREDEGEGDANKTKRVLPEEQAEPSSLRIGGKGEYEAAESLVAIICEPIPADRNLLKNSPDYHHFRTIYAAFRTLNLKLQKTNDAVQLKFVMAHRSTDIPKFFRLFADQICCIVFGPNFPLLSEVTLRIMANSSRSRMVVVCHNPFQALFSWDRLSKLADDFNIMAYRNSTEESEARDFWSLFLNRELRPLIEERLKTIRDRAAEKEYVLPAEEIRNLLLKDYESMELLPSFPATFRQAIGAIEERQPFSQLVEIIESDGILQGLVSQSLKKAAYNISSGVESLPIAIAAIGVEELKKTMIAQVVGNLLDEINQPGFHGQHFLFHSVCTGYMAQILSLNLDEPSAREREILRCLSLPQYSRDILKKLRLWERFKLADEFDAFTGGLLHDVGKLLNLICYPDIFPSILYEIEQKQWQGSLLESETALLWDFQHPATGSALLLEWDIFSNCIEPIHLHHQIHRGSAPETVLIAMANCLVKGLYSFPHRLDIPQELRDTFLGPVANPDLLDNPLAVLFENIVELFELEQNRLLLTAQEVESGNYQPQKLEELFGLAKRSFENSQSYGNALSGQNPEFSQVLEYAKVSAEEALALPLLLKGSLQALVKGLCQNISRD